MELGREEKRILTTDEKIDMILSIIEPTQLHLSELINPDLAKFYIENCQGWRFYIRLPANTSYDIIDLKASIERNNIRLDIEHNGMQRLYTHNIYFD